MEETSITLKSNMPQAALVLNLSIPYVTINLNAIYNTITQTFDFSPTDFSPSDFSTT